MGGRLATKARSRELIIYTASVDGGLSTSLPFVPGYLA